MDKKELVKLVEDGEGIIVAHDNEWRYPQQNDDQRSCPMLDFMFKVEYAPNKPGGTLIFVPDRKK